MDKDGEDVLRGSCDLCGEASDGAMQECNMLSCTYTGCKEILYHQACLDKFLRSNKLDKSRKTGFKCPRGCGKGSSFSTGCPGRIDKSHPIFPRNETKKNKAPPPMPDAGPGKTKKDKDGTTAAAPPLAVQTPSTVKLPKPGDTKKETAGQKMLKATATTAASTAATAAASAAGTPMALGTSAAPAANGVGAGGATRLGTAAAAAVENGSSVKQQLLEAKAAARRDLGLERSGFGAGGAAAAGSTAMASKAVGVGTPAAAVATAAGGGAVGSTAAAAWARGATAAGTAAAASPSPQPPSDATPSLHTLAQYPQLQQLFQVETKPKAQKPAAAPAPAPAAAPTPSLQNQQHFPPVKAAAPTPAVPVPAAPTGPGAAAATSLRPGPVPDPAPAPAPAPTTSPLLLLLQPHRAAAATAAAAAPSPTPSPLPAPTLAPAPAASPPPPPPRRTSAGGITPSSPCPPPSSSPSPVPAPAPGLAGALPVGMEYAESEQELDPSKLTKAQKKNLKRAERKKKAAQESDHMDSHSHASSDVARDLDRSEHAVLREEMFVQALVCRKTIAVLQELRRLAFTEWQAAAAVQRHGGDVASCVAWLLEHSEQGIEAVGAASGAALCSSGALPVVDVSEEVRALGEVQVGLGLGVDTVQAAVLEALGEVSLAIELMLDAHKGGGAGGGTELASSDGAASEAESSVHSAVASWRSSCTAALQLQPPAPGRGGSWAMDSLPVPQDQQYAPQYAPPAVNGGFHPRQGQQTLSQVEQGLVGGASRLTNWALGPADGEACGGSAAAGSQQPQRCDGSGLLMLLGARSDGANSMAGHSDGGFTLNDWMPSSGTAAASQRSTLSTELPGVGEEAPAAAPVGGFGGFALGLGGRSLFGGFALAPSGTSST